ncbi:MAG: hypothetical protein LZF62_130040 [Nitrospira sp.]|nr:MAG: hypothetical protein LZF62_130040 [Nitrospira sp.]
MLLDFARNSDLDAKTEVEKVLAFAYYSAKTTKQEHFSSKDITQWFIEARLHQPNISRLLKSLKVSRLVVQDKTSGTFRLHARAEQQLAEAYDKLLSLEPGEEIVHCDTFLPTSVVANTRGYIESLTAQINAAYEANVFDGCAVLMRRLIEICLIHAFEHSIPTFNIKRPDGQYVDLAEIISHAKSSASLSLSKGTKACLDDFRVLGNFSAHKIYYNAKRADIKRVIFDYRAAVEELLYKAGLKC